MISVTALSSYLYCARKLYLQRVLGLKEPPKESLLRGTIRHRTYEEINNVDERIVKGIKKSTNLAQILQGYKQEHSKILRNVIIEHKKELKQFNLSMLDVFKKTWPLILSDSEARAYNIFDFVEKNKVYGAELWESLVPKIRSELRVESERLQLRGIIDEVHVYPAGYVPFELKTGKAPNEGVWPGHKIQLGAYALLLEDKFGNEIKEGFVKYLDSKKECQIVINPFLRQEVKDLIEKAGLLLRSKELPDFCKNENKCKSCGLKDICHNPVVLKDRMDKLDFRNI